MFEGDLEDDGVSNQKGAKRAFAPHTIDNLPAKSRERPFPSAHTQQNHPDLANQGIEGCAALLVYGRTQCMTGTELYPIVEQTSKSLREAIGTSLAEAWQGIIGDRVTSWRIANAAKLNEKLGAELIKTGATLNLEKIPPGVAFTWFDKATQADEPEIQALFAKLLANAATGNTEALAKRNIDLVSRLAPDDARLLEILGGLHYHAATFRYEGSPRRARQFDFPLSRSLDEANFVDKTSIDALIALGVLRLEQEVDLDDADLRYKNRVPEVKIYTSEFLRITTIGTSLLQALFPYDPGTLEG